MRSLLGGLLAFAVSAPASATFVDATDQAGMSGTGNRSGAAWGDFNGDGWPDAYVGSHFYDDPTLFMNQGNGHFRDVTAAVLVRPTNIDMCPGINGPWGDQHGRAWADLDNDGDQDLIQLVGAQVGQGCGPKQLYINANGRLADRAEQLGVIYPGSRSRTPLWVDYDNDGLLDLYQSALGRPDHTSPPTMFHATNATNMRFTAVRGAVGFTPLSDDEAILADVGGGDKRPEIITSGAFATPLRLAPGAIRTPAQSLHFVDVSTPLFMDVTRVNIPVTHPFDAVAGDFDGDLRQDLFIFNNWAPGAAAEGHQLYLNRASGFVRRNFNLRSSSPSAVAGDFDNDGDLDIFYDAGLGRGGQSQDLPNVILWNNGSGNFVADLTAAGASGGTGHRSPKSVSVADYDRNGTLDLLLTYDGATAPAGTVQLYRNLPNANHWLEVDLQGTASNRDAVGARVFITAGGRTQLRAQNGGVHAEWSQNHQRLHFGLGQRTAVATLRVSWPAGPDTVLHDVRADRVVRILQ